MLAASSLPQGMPVWTTPQWQYDRVDGSVWASTPVLPRRVHGTFTTDGARLVPAGTHQDTLPYI